MLLSPYHCYTFVAFTVSNCSQTFTWWYSIDRPFSPSYTCWPSCTTGPYPRLFVMVSDYSTFSGSELQISTTLLSLTPFTIHKSHFKHVLLLLPLPCGENKLPSHPVSASHSIIFLCQVTPQSPALQEKQAQPAQSLPIIKVLG